MVRADGEDVETSREPVKFSSWFLPKSEITELMCVPARTQARAERAHKCQDGAGLVGGAVSHRGAAAATAKSLQSCLPLCDPINGSPQGSTIPGILQARTLEWVAISFSNA